MFCSSIYKISSGRRQPSLLLVWFPCPTGFLNNAASFPPLNRNSLTFCNIHLFTPWSEFDDTAFVPHVFIWNDCKQPIILVYSTKTDKWWGVLEFLWIVLPWASQNSCYLFCSSLYAKLSLTFCWLCLYFLYRYESSHLKWTNKNVKLFNLTFTWVVKHWNRLLVEGL